MDNDIDKLSYDDLKMYLKNKYLPDTNQDLADKVFDHAWDYGHAYGNSEVQSFYIDLTDFAK